jgi:putative PIN family toxin of toxin-antitoxin system
MIPNTRRLVLDTSVLVAGLRSRRGASHELLRLALKGEVTALLSTALLLEYESVLTRPSLVPYSAEEIDRFLSGFAAAAECLMVHWSARPFLPDPADEHVLDLALNANADAIVTFDVRHLGPTRSFGIDVMTPAAFLDQFH